jgi:hypothetical protein
VTEPAQHFRNGLDRFPRGYKWPADHHHRQREVARGFDFCRGRIAAGVFSHDEFGAEIRQHGAVVGAFERPARHDHLGIGQRQRRARRVDEPNQVGMLRVRGESLELQAADAEKHPARRRAERFGRRLQIIDLDPAVAGRALPGRALERQQRHGGHGAGSDRVCTHLRRERMGGVDDARNVSGAKIVHQTINAAKAAKAPGNRRRRRVFGTAGIGQYRVDIWIVRHRLREPVGVGGAAEDQDAQWKGRGGCHDRER